MNREIIFMGLKIHIPSNKIPHPMWSYHGPILVSNNTFLPNEATQYSKRWGFMTSSTSTSGGPIGYVALTHFTSRVRAVLVTVAILFWKSNWTGGTATFPFRQVCCENQKGWKFELLFFSGARWVSEHTSGPASRPVNIIDTRRAILNQKNGW